MSRVHPLTILCTLCCVTGFTFAAVSTSDFVAHLDRQVHGIHCSFLPGLATADSSGASGCHATLMSPYSSVFRDAIWGGIPIALPAMAVFSFLGFWSLWIAINQRDREERSTGFLFAGSLIPLSASALMGYLSLVQLDAACKLCIGIYASSGVLSLASLVLWTKAEASPDRPRDDRDRKSRARARAPLSWGALGLAFSTGVVCVAVSVGAYAASAPDFSSYIGACGSISRSGDSEALLAVGPQRGNPEMLEVIDPLCPSCRGFEERFSKMEIAEAVDRKLLLFPLDESCNWMIDRSIHPGACSISEAVLCSSDPGPVLEWAFNNQKEILEAAEQSPDAAARLARARFPALADCIGSTGARAKLNQSLRWAVKNKLPIVTPQVFVEGNRLCGEDTDLGLDFALPRLIAHTATQPSTKPELKSEDVARPAPAIKQPPRHKPQVRLPPDESDSSQPSASATSPSKAERKGGTATLAPSQPSQTIATPRAEEPANDADGSHVDSQADSQAEPEAAPETAPAVTPEPPPPASPPTPTEEVSP